MTDTGEALPFRVQGFSILAGTPCLALPRTGSPTIHRLNAWALDKTTPQIPSDGLVLYAMPHYPRSGWRHALHRWGPEASARASPALWRPPPSTPCALRVFSQPCSCRMLIRVHVAHLRHTLAVTSCALLCSLQRLGTKGSPCCLSVWSPCLVRDGSARHLDPLSCIDALLVDW